MRPSASSGPDGGTEVVHIRSKQRRARRPRPGRRRRAGRFGREPQPTWEPREPSQNALPATAPVTPMSEENTVVLG